MNLPSLDLIRLPLQGVRLIEASAGTGKTYTIASLYLRLLLERGLSVKQILVVTFTNAATEELRDRIRTRIREALRFLQGSHVGDDVLTEILSAIQDSKQATQQLKDALTLMDEAAVFTIHGFCQRMLSENAFESGSLFEAEFITDESDYLRTISEDFWRSHFYAKSEADASWVASQWSGPGALLSETRRYLSQHQLEIIPQVSESQLASMLDQRQQLVSQVQQQWREQGEAISELLSNNPGFNGNKYRKNSVAQALAGMTHFSQQSQPLSLPPRLDLLTAKKLATVMKKGFEPPQHPFFELCDALSDGWAAPEQMKRIQVLQQFITYTRQALVERKHQHSVISTDDLLLHLHHALQGEGSERLATHIRQQYPMAMIDEFQDTDPIQYAIFRKIYHDADACGLYMIGDPKQAIYSFRGADIFTYMQARHDTEHHYTLQTNWRSSSALVAAVNQLFEQADKPFIYQADIPFYPVQAAQHTDKTPLRMKGNSVAALQVWQVNREGDKPLSKGTAKTLLAQRSAQQIAQLLNGGLSGEVMIGDEPLLPKDIAVLVRSHSEAREVQHALRGYGISSAYISRDSVFDSTEAQALGRLLLAVLEPGNERRLRATLCDGLLGYSANKLFEVLDDENQWEPLLEQFQHYHLQWRDHGFMTMFQNLLHQQRLPQQLLVNAGGERALSNLLQLAEILQANSKQQHGMEGLTHWYMEQLESKGEDEERQLRLESDEALVQIVTIHKSKGLEYSVVFLPFIYESMPTRDNQPLLFHRESDYQLLLDMGSKDYSQHYQLADRERLAEELRLLYVALTRAKHLCYLAWGAIKDADRSPLAYLLYGNQMASLSDQQLFTKWQDLADASDGTIQLSPLPDVSGALFQGTDSAIGSLSPRQFMGHIERNWQVSSFTLLTSQRSHRVMLPDYDAVETIVPTEVHTEQDIFSFPRGANAGTMMHALFENIDFSQDQGHRIEEVTAEQLSRYGFDESWQAVISTMVTEVLNTPLDVQTGLSLSKISQSQRLVELEFYFPLTHLNAVKLNKILNGLEGYPGAGNALNFHSHQGMMTGFIDLIFEYQGRYYIADYKSNHLGNHVSDYDQANLDTVMQQHRYDLQYLIYTVALHRYLQKRIVDYDYQHHFGGIYYLFLRGMRADSSERYGVFQTRPEKALIEALDNLFLA